MAGESRSFRCLNGYCAAENVGSLRLTHLLVMTSSRPSRFSFLVALCTGLTALLVTHPDASAQAVVRISGTGSGVGGMHLLAKAFMAANPDTKIEVQPAIGSGGGISALLAGQLEVAVSNRKPKDTELSKQALVSVEYAHTPFVVAVSRDLGINALSATQLAGLYGEGAVSFPNGKRARPVLRLSDTTDTELLKSFAPEVASAVDAAAQRRGMLNANTDSDAADLLERTAGAFGVSTLALIESEKRSLVAVTIDNKVPTVDNLASGAYPYFKALHLIVSPDAGANTKRFAAFVQSSAGKALLRAHGHAPR
jgi:phosphate transport system substrate-binding protein